VADQPRVQPVPASVRHLLPLLVGLAGFSFLAYEVSWYRLLALALGATVSASTIVLAVFMAGLGAGAALWGKLVAGRTALARPLALLLAGVGACGALSWPFMTSWLPGLQVALGGGVAADVVAFVVAALGVLLPSLLMGGVFPLAAQLAARAGGSVAGVLGRLYAAETLGSTLGGLVTGYVLLGTLGQRGTLLVAVALNLALAAVLWCWRVEPTDANAEAPRKARGDKLADPALARRTALVGAAACGFVMLALQVLWLRMFRIYLTNTSYTFALVSSLVILGVFLGSALYARRGPSLADPRGALVRTMALLAALALAGLWLMLRLPQTLMFPFEEYLQDPLLRVGLDIVPITRSPLPSRSTCCNQSAAEPPLR